MLEYPGMDYTEYSLSFLKRRLTRLATQQRIRRKEQFLERLHEADFRALLLTELCVANTEMFRDPALWRLLRDKFLPALPQECTCLWLPHETSGEDSYSLALILHEAELPGSFQIIAQSPSHQHCQAVEAGLINQQHHEQNLSNYKRLEDRDAYENYLVEEAGKSCIAQSLRQNINCVQGHFLNRQPKRKDIGLILFRNVGLYFNPRLNHKALRLLIDALMPGGYLVLGLKDHLPTDLEKELMVCDSAERIYQKPLSKEPSYGIHRF